jgi:hypothetical protein
LILWGIGTLGHFLLTARWLARAGTATTRDEWGFQTMVAGTGTLSIALHLIASTTGLTITRVLLVLAVGHAVAWYVGRDGVVYAGRGFPGLSEVEGSRANVAPLKGRPAYVESVLETAALIVLTVVVLQWILIAVTSTDVSGSDAAHYHVPNAVNLALGASPFDLPPTSHLYPMGSSTLAAWFILPVQTTLLTDLVMVLPFLLLVASAGWIFRQLTSLSGLAWSTWMMLALFGTPLFRSASLMSADLLFAAASMAFAAALLTPLVRRPLRSTDVWLIALSLGLLLGSKVTGVVVAALIGLPAVLALATFKLRPASARKIGAAKATPYGVLGLCGGAALAVIFAGGIWLVRNWWVWGSPVAPNGVALFGFTVFPGAAYEATTYLSVLGDLKDKPGYQLWDRAKHFIDVWLSPWYLPGLGALLLIPADFIASRRRGDTSSARLWTTIVACGTGAVMAWFLIGAPWTSLEWTEGFSLRYALPWLAMLPLVAWVGLFPEALPWHRRTTPAIIAGIVISVSGLAVLGRHQELPFPPLLTPSALAAERLAQEARAKAIADRPRTNGERIYDTVLSFEAKEGHSCDAEGRRFFVTNRFDEPGALQGARLTNRVFYAARDVKVTARVRPGMGPCDYLITERAIMNTNKGSALHAGLNPSGTLVDLGTVGDVVLLVHR